MKIDKGSFINDFIDKNLRQYSIPVYQRNYEWSAEQCEKLFEVYYRLTNLTVFILPVQLFTLYSKMRIK